MGEISFMKGRCVHEFFRETDEIKKREGTHPR